MKYRKLAIVEEETLFPGLTFFAQAIDELSFPYTIDSFRAPTMNPASLATEALGLIEAQKKTGFGGKSLDHVLDEFESRLYGNAIVTSLLGISVDRALKFDRSNLDASTSRLRVLGSQLPRAVYATRTMKLVSERLDSCKKNDLYFLARELISALQSCGVSLEYINDTVQRAFFSSETLPAKMAFQKFCKDVFPHQHNFEVVFRVGGVLNTLSDDEGKAFGLSFSERAPNQMSSHIDSIGPIGHQERYVTVSGVQAPDRYSAARNGKMVVTRAHDILSLYHHKSTLSVSENTLTVKKCCGSEVEFSSSNDNHMQRIQDRYPATAKREFTKLLKGVKYPFGESREQFFRVIEFHGTALASSVSENQLISLWTCFEILFAETSTDSSKANIVVSGVSPLLATTYLRRLMKYVYFDLVRYDRSGLTRIIRKAEPDSSLDMVEKLALIIADPAFQTVYDELQGALGGFSLLRYRLYSLKKELGKPKDLRDKMEMHTRRIDWQIHRIYRARNAVVHSAAEVDNAPALVMNAHEYFDLAFSALLELGSGDAGFSALSDAVNYCQVVYEEYQSYLKEVDGIRPNTVQRLLWEPRIVNRREVFSSSL